MTGTDSNRQGSGNEFINEYVVISACRDVFFEFTSDLPTRQRGYRRAPRAKNTKLFHKTEALRRFSDKKNSKKRATDVDLSDSEQVFEITITSLMNEQVIIK